MTFQNFTLSTRFETFDLEPHESCRFDYVEVYDGLVMDKSKKIGKYCGNIPPDPIKSVSNSLLVVFITDSSVAKGGFSAGYTTTLGKSPFNLIWG